jgi:hypothetical protein
MGELKPPGKPFDISKWEVQEAYQKVKANKGAPGVDGVALAEFEKDLKGNLYKIWNRMSSGSYFPPPVKAVEIPKPHGSGTRILGVPTGPANCAVAQAGWGSGILRHGHAPVPSAGRAAAAGAVRAEAGRRAGGQLRGRAAGLADGAAGLDRSRRPGGGCAADL